MKTPKEWFEEELSGEPLTQESVIEVLEMVQKDAWNEALDKAAESACIDLYDYIGSSFKIFEQDSRYAINDGTYVEISKQSILKLKL